MRRLRSIGLVLAGCCLLLSALFLTASGKDKPDQKLISRGKYLVSAIGCNDCHTPFKMGPKGPEPDMTRFLSGHPQDMVLPPAPAAAHGSWIGSFAATMTAWAGPWGVSFTRNLTPDKETGLGDWTEQNFITTIRTGKHGKGTRSPSPYALPGISKHDGWRSQSNLRIPADDSGREEQGPGTDPTRGHACRG